MASETAVRPAAISATLESVLKKEEDGTSSLRMYWLDLTEKNHDLYLFGKIEIPAEEPNAAPRFVSCCAIVHNLQRQLLCLPRPGEDGEPASMQDVHAEVRKLLVPRVLPARAGCGFAAKPVTRKYAFEDPSVPRGEATYLKVVYDAKFPAPDPELCEQGGTFIQRIFGHSVGLTENFLIKRRLMGPGWVTVKNPFTTDVPSTWTKLEFHINDPKNIRRMPDPCPPVPPLVAVTLKMKTVVHPKSSQHEIVCLSAICHRHVTLDKRPPPADAVTQLTLVRPLGASAPPDALSHFPHDLDRHAKAAGGSVARAPNERALLNRFMTQLGNWDPDVIVGHNAWGFDAQILLGRCLKNKVPGWSKLGRRRNTTFSTRKVDDRELARVMGGRILCDTYLAAQEFWKETSYSLTSLAGTQLKERREEIQPQEVPLWYNEGKTVVQLALHTLRDAQLVNKLMDKLQVLPLTKQLTNIAGNRWARTVKGSNRAERNEFLLLHEFHTLKYIVPEGGFRKKEAAGKKAKFSGGLVLEPKRGLYDTCILLLDFNSLYPSIIQEYNFCFTTVEWSAHQEKVAAEASENDAPSGDILAPLPDGDAGVGVLPRVIKTLVERRRNVKNMMKKAHDPATKNELDVRQQALKLTANSMYGCLGFSHSRFYAQPIAALVTAMGREVLQRAVEVAQDTVGLEVIYGDTDSIMINTRIRDQSELPKVRELGERVKREVNKLYRTLELEIDGIYRSMLLLKKKKYAALVMNDDGTESKELKGLDLVRRDWCIQSKDSGRFVIDQILSGQEREQVIDNIHRHLEELAKKMRENELALDKYVITKSLSKHPKEYPDAKSQPHVLVALDMLKNNRPISTGDHIPYVICLENESKNFAERARHPEEIERSAGALKVDIEWYLNHQILPPLSRLIEPIEGTSQATIAEKLGLDSSKFIKHVPTTYTEETLVDYTPESSRPDRERFKDATKLQITCLKCGETNEFPGVFYTPAGDTTPISGLACTNPACSAPLWGDASHWNILTRVSNATSMLLREHVQKYYGSALVCDDSSCGLKTHQLSNFGSMCLQQGCNGHLVEECDEKFLFTEMKYAESLFSFDHGCKQLEEKFNKKELERYISKEDREVFSSLHELMKNILKLNAYNWVSPKLFSALFGKAKLT